MLSARSAADLDAVYAPFKTGSKTSLAERARALGLGETATNLLEGTRPFVIDTNINIPANEVRFWKEQNTYQSCGILLTLPNKENWAPQREGIHNIHKKGVPFFALNFLLLTELITPTGFGHLSFDL